jgi:hypothetical protein
MDEKRPLKQKAAGSDQGILEIFQAVSPAESGSLLGWWRRIGNRERKLSAT